jgi:hypothetical protein
VVIGAASSLACRVLATPAALPQPHGSSAVAPSKFVHG